MPFRPLGVAVKIGAGELGGDVRMPEPPVSLRALKIVPCFCPASLCPMRQMCSWGILGDWSAPLSCFPSEELLGKSPAGREWSGPSTPSAALFLLSAR